MVKIVISLPDDLLSEIEKARLAGGLSRSEFFCQLAKDHLRQERKRELEQQYIRGYQEQPETVEEIAFSEAVMAEAWADLPWEDESEE